MYFVANFRDSSSWGIKTIHSCKQMCENLRIQHLIENPKLIPTKCSVQHYYIWKLQSAKIMLAHLRLLSVK